MITGLDWAVNNSFIIQSWSILVTFYRVAIRLGGTRTLMFFCCAERPIHVFFCWPTNYPCVRVCSPRCNTRKSTDSFASAAGVSRGAHGRQLWQMDGTLRLPPLPSAAGPLCCLEGAGLPSFKTHWPLDRTSMLPPFWRGQEYK